MNKARQRLDAALVARGLYESRSRARDAVLRGAVAVNGVTATKPAQPVADGATLAIADPAMSHVSRAALKLIHGLDAFNLSPRDLSCLDIGASTGGFTQVLVERGAGHVTALDVGHGQLHPSLRNHPRVTIMEGLNARDLTIGHLARNPQFITCDVSFISMTLALLPALQLATDGAKLVALIKPQFEAGRAALDGQGIVRDPGIHAVVCKQIEAWLEAANWRVTGVAQSPVQGGDGNTEFLIGAEKSC